MHKEQQLEKQFTAAMKSIARRADLKSYVERTPQLQQLLHIASKQYVTGEARKEGLAVGRKLVDKGYAVSLEYIGENTSSAAECEAAALEMGALIDEIAQLGFPARVSFDLSHIGLSLGTELAYSHLARLSEQAGRAGIELFISMEESGKTDDILSVYERAAALYSHLGITLQAQLYRTPADLEALSARPRKLRIVKGAYQEPEGSSLPRSKELDTRYIELVEKAISQGHQVSIATHDELIIDEVLSRGWLVGGKSECEMLYGIRPDLSSRLRSEGLPVRIYLTYGEEWYLYLCHRIAEYPPNLYKAIIAMASNTAVEAEAEYN